MTDLDRDAAGHRVRLGARAATSRVDRAIARTRRAVYPLHGLDPDDPRD